MHYTIHARDVELNEELKDLVDKRINHALSRFEDQLGDITVRLEDINGPKGGVDKVCRLQVSLASKGNLVAEHSAASMDEAISEAADRLARQVKDELERRRTLHRKVDTKAHEAD